MKIVLSPSHAKMLVRLLKRQIKILNDLMNDIDKSKNDFLNDKANEVLKGNKNQVKKIWHQEKMDIQFLIGQLKEEKNDDKIKNRLCKIKRNRKLHQSDRKKIRYCRKKQN